MRWYEQESPGLGDRLLTEIQVAISLVSQHPAIGEAVQRLGSRRNVRRLPLRHFPFLLVYREFDDHLEVVALAHTSRKPRYWPQPLTQPTLNPSPPPPNVT